MKKIPFNVGDLVVLKSGGPVMTVKRIIQPHALVDDGGSVECQWFAGKKMETGIFPVPSLNPHDGEQK